MWDMVPRKVLVALDSSPCEAALRFGVAEACRRGCGLHLVHVARMALRDQLVAPGVYPAIDSMAAENAELLGQLADVSLGAPNEASAAFVLRFLKSNPTLDRPARNEYLHHVVRYSSVDQLPQAYTLARDWDAGLNARDGTPASIPACYCPLQRACPAGAGLTVRSAPSVTYGTRPRAAMRAAVDCAQASSSGAQ